MNEGWVAGWIESGATPPATRRPDATPAERRLQAVGEGDWLRVGSSIDTGAARNTSVVAGDVIRFERWYGRRRVEVIAEVKSAVWCGVGLYFGLLAIGGDDPAVQTGECLLRRGREVYGRWGNTNLRRLPWDNEAARAPAERAQLRAVKEAGRLYYARKG